ncbi:unnamed protein product [Paramecium octaurelia]|uniref:Uncharacterized protein n=1 Tax=Paramecium octaurelia TaxID=43137 RepID=A0A8S1YHQ4_PAROT|nr:unnamed protein product [Paramecium octaurelia]
MMANPITDYFYPYILIKCERINAIFGAISLKNQFYGNLIRTVCQIFTQEGNEKPTSSQKKKLREEYHKRKALKIDRIYFDTILHSNIKFLQNLHPGKLDQKRIQVTAIIEFVLNNNFSI